ncbi:SAP domain-containing protein [Janibacter terrae]|uniref:SAP domain-containing protein n=1 Tax=Janibacter terrae TaxID=103817 RepID=UPI0031F9383D
MATVSQNTLVRKSDTGEVVVLNAGEEVPEWAVSQVGDHLVDADDQGEEGGYESMTVADLRAEIESRNEGREEADLVPSDGRKADLVAALNADDDN